MSVSGQREAAPQPRDVIAAAQASLGEGEAGWVVGGSLRDELLGLAVKDVDIAVDGSPALFARRLADALGGAVYSSSDAFGTWRVVLEGLHVDVAPLRSNRGTSGAADRETRLVADLRARDFTVNALARPLAGGGIVDPLGGLGDLQARRLRLCSPAALDDDPLRIVRLARLSQGFGMTPDAAAAAAAHRASGSLTRVSGERLRDELSAVLALRHAGAAVRQLAQWDALRVVLPEVDDLRGVQQNAYHHLDVFGHTVEALGYARGVVTQLGGEGLLTPADEAGFPGVDVIVPLRWAILLHDCGKRAARAVNDEGRVTFWHHDEIGSQMTVGVAERLRMSARAAAYLSTLVRQHLRLGFLVREQPLTRRALTRYRRDVSPYVFESVVLSLCDRLATRGEKTTHESLARHFRLARTLWGSVSKQPVPRLLSGEDVMETLGVGPGRIVGLALDAIEEEVDAGEVTSPEEARAFLRRWQAGGERDDA